jgi:transposase
MLIVPPGVKVLLTLGYTDMRKGMDRLAMLLQEVPKNDPFSGRLFAFRGKKASMLKILFLDGNGLCLFTKRMAGCDSSITLTPARAGHPNVHHAFLYPSPHVRYSPSTSATDRANALAASTCEAFSARRS